MKKELVKARVSEAMKNDLDALAEEKGETLAVIVRDALRDYIEKHSARVTETAPKYGGRPKQPPSDRPRKQQAG